MKVLMVLYLALPLDGIDNDQYIMAAVPKVVFESVEDCHTESAKLRDSLPEYVIGAHCMETNWDENPKYPLSRFRPAK
jgi:hypothetical protein